MFPDDPSSADAAAARTAVTDLPGSVVRLIGRYYFGTAVAVALASMLIVGVLPSRLSGSWRIGLLSALAAYALGAGWAFRASRDRRHRLDVSLFVTGVGAMALVAAAATGFGDGLRSPTLGFCGLIVCMLCGVTSLRWGAALAAACVVDVLFLGWAEQAGLTATVPGGTPLFTAMVFHVLIVATGVAGGTLLSRVLDHYLRAASEREQRFRNLLAIAVDWYWEQDAQFRFTHVSANPAARPLVESVQRLGRRPWELGASGGLDEAAAAAHRADLEAHRPFTMTVRRPDAGGHERTLAISGEPKFDAGGAFCGYWGVGRDITDEVRSQRATAASESRYRQLFQRSP